MLGGRVIFLGGTCNESTWRKELTLVLDCAGMKYFDPIVSDWNDKAQAIEEEVKARGNTINLFVITKEMTGVFSIAEAVDSSNKKPKRTVFMVDHRGFSAAQLRSLTAVKNMIRSNGAHVFDDSLSLLHGLKALYFEA